MSHGVIKLSILIVNYNTKHLFRELASSLAGAPEFLESQVHFVDNASSDDSANVLPKYFPSAGYSINESNVGFGRANNQALHLLLGNFVLLLNTDAFVSPDTLTKTLAWMDAHPDCGVLGVKLTERSGELQPSCRYFPTPFNIFLGRTGLQRLFPWVVLVDDMVWDHATVRECDWVPGCYYLVRREVLD